MPSDNFYGLKNTGRGIGLFAGEGASLGWDATDPDSEFSSQTGSLAGFGNTNAKAMNDAASKSPQNTFLQGMKFGYMAEQAISAPIMAWRQAKREKEMLGIRSELIGLQVKALDTAADDAMRAGHQQSAQLTYQYGQMKSQARVGMAASGVRVGGAGSSAEVLASYDIVKEMRRNVILSNAVAASFGYRRQAANSRGAQLAVDAARSGIKPWAAALTAMLSSAMEMSDQMPNVQSLFGGGGGGLFEGGLKNNGSSISGLKNNGSTTSGLRVAGSLFK